MSPHPSAGDGQEVRSPLQRRRLSDILADHNLTEVQIMILHEQGGPHHIQNVGLRLAAAHRRLDEYEGLLRERALYHHIDPGCSVAELRVSLAELADRRDAAGRGRRREDRRKLLAQFSAFMDSLPVAVVVADADAGYIEVNHAATELLGYTRDELLGMTVTEVVAYSPKWTGVEYTRYLEDGHWAGELEVRRSDGHVLAVQAHAHVVDLFSGRLYVSVLTPLV